MPRFLASICCALSALCCFAEERSIWTTSRVSGSPDPPKPYHIERVFPKLRFTNPVQLRAMPGGDRMLLMQVDGKLFAFDNKPSCDQAELILDVGAGLENMRAFGFGIHPEFETNRTIFLVYSTDIRGVPHAARLSRFRIPEQAPLKIDRDSEAVLITWTSGGHNGSTVEFDADGMLYFSAGDGSRPFPPDEFNVGQDLSDLRATICRIDVDQTDGDRPYRIPQDNPFVGVPAARGEIWAYGFRNPWRFTIDQPTGRLLCGDVGWELWESVFDVQRGGNYGWSLFEGPGQLRDNLTPGPTPILKPLTAYSHSLGQSITGGIVYRGSELPELSGSYLYGDYVSGLLWGLRSSGAEVTENRVLAETGIPIITFAHASNGEALVVSYDGGIYRLVENPLADRPNDFPTKLSQTGLFESLKDLSPQPGVYQYEITANSYREGVAAQYHVAVPGDEHIQVAKQKRQWTFPAGTVFVRTFNSQDHDASDASPVRIETQLLHFDGLSWQPYSYLWDPSQGEAHLMGRDGGRQPLDSLGLKDRQWEVHSRAQCRSCHTKQAGGAVGFSLENLSDVTIARFVDIGLLDQTAPKWWNLRKTANPSDQASDLDARARSYLAANCAHCHRRGGGGSVALDLEYSNPNEKINAIGVAPMQGAFEIEDAKVIAPGDPQRSVLLYRMATGGVGRMPKLAHHDPDPMGLILISDWINSLPGDRLPPSNATTSIALGTLVACLRSGDYGPATEAARAASVRGESLVEGLFERYLPQSERRRRLGPNIDAEQILQLPGDSDRGRRWLTETRGAQCLACHRVGGQGQYVGPSLDGIGNKRTKNELLESVLDPSAKIDAHYRTLAVLTDEGTVLTGLQMDEDATRLTIRSADGKDHLLEKNSIETQRIQKESLMPTGLAESMTARELADLIAFLYSLR